MTYKIPFNKPYTYNYVGKLFDGTLTNGPYTRLCKEWIERRYPGSRVYMTHSGTGALELMAMIYRPKYATIPSFTHVSTVNAFARVGTKIKLVDISLNDFTADMCSEIRDVGCDYNGAVSACVYADSAHGFPQHHCDAAVSFHETKNVSCGEGGALILYGSFNKADQIYRMGTNREAFNRGEVDQYEWTCVGSSFTPSEFQMAYLWGQLERYDEIQARRAELWSRYADAFGATIPQGVSHVFPLLLQNRNEFIRKMAERGIQCVSHYTPLHLSPMGRKRGGHDGQLPNTEYVSRSIVRLPLYYSMTDAEQMEVIKAVKECL